MAHHPTFILLADDDQEDLDLLSETLLQLDGSIQLKMVNSGRMLIDFLEKTEDDKLPSLIVLDYNMPNMNGAEVLEKLCSNTRYQKIPMVIWSTSNNNNYIKECIEKGATHYFVKPATQKTLVDQAEQMLKMC